MGIGLIYCHLITIMAASPGLESIPSSARRHTKHELQYVLCMPGVTLIIKFIKFQFHTKLNTGLFILLRIDVSETVGMSAYVGGKEWKSAFIILHRLPLRIHGITCKKPIRI